MAGLRGCRIAAALWAFGFGMALAPAVWADMDEDSSHWEEFRAQKEQMMSRMLGELGLSADQLAAIEAQRSAHTAQKEALRARLKEKKEALRAALDAPATDRAQIDALMAEIAVLDAERLKSRVEAVLAIKALLTPGQFADLRAKKKEMLDQHKEKLKKMLVGERGGEV
jgi:Spy/CpxP family protein refolding chaperone